VYPFTHLWMGLMNGSLREKLNLLLVLSIVDVQCNGTVRLNFSTFWTSDIREQNEGWRCV